MHILNSRHCKLITNVFPVPCRPSVPAWWRLNYGERRLDNRSKRCGKVLQGDGKHEWWWHRRHACPRAVRTSPCPGQFAISNSVLGSWSTSLQRWLAWLTFDGGLSSHSTEPLLLGWVGWLFSGLSCTFQSEHYASLEWQSRKGNVTWEGKSCWFGEHFSSTVSHGSYNTLMQSENIFVPQIHDVLMRPTTQPMWMFLLPRIAAHVLLL